VVKSPSLWTFVLELTVLHYYIATKSNSHGYKKLPRYNNEPSQIDAKDHVRFLYNGI
jgi:hypothetical protein